jgi:pimeloyl-ACP methyl ester carboxylesterase
MRSHLRLAASLTICLVALVSPAAAQQTVPVVFVHGFKSSGGTWEAAAARLQSQLAIQPYRPTSRWQDGYSTQANQLHSLLPSLPSSTVLVGHSNGGIVSRQLSRSRSSAAIITTSTPHTGAPIARNASLFVGYNLGIFDRTSDISNAWGYLENPWTWILWEIADVVDNAVQIGYDSVFYLGATLGVDIALPVWQEMRPGSSFLLDLNSDSNKAREASSIPTRVGIINQAKNFYAGGLFRAVVPEYADSISIALNVGADVLDYWATYLYVRGPEDFDNYQRAETLWNLAAWMATHEAAWCQAVSDPTPLVLTSVGICWENDSMVPTFSQVYPGGIPIQRRDTAVHAHLTRDLDMQNGLYYVLTTFAHVPPLGTSAPPPPPVSGDNKLASGERLLVNEKIVSGDGRYRVTYQGDGNLVLRYSDGTALWSSKTAGTTTNYTIMQTDGNAVVRNASSAAVWHAGTFGNPGAYMVAKNDGNVVILSSAGAQLWQTGTAGKTGTSTGSTTSGGTGKLPSGGVLSPGQSVISTDGRFRLSYQNDGNLVLYKTGVAALWATNTNGTSPGKVKMQSDGNLVVYNSAGTAIWASHTAGHAGAYLRVQNDGNLVIYSSSGTAIWATGTRG